MAEQLPWEKYQKAAGGASNAPPWQKYAATPTASGMAGPSGAAPASQASAPDAGGFNPLQMIQNAGQTLGQMGRNIANIPGALAAQGQQIAADPGSIPDRFNSFASGMINNIPIAGPLITPAANQAKAWVQTNILHNPETAAQVGAYEQANRQQYPTEATEGGVFGTVAPFALGGSTALGAKLLGLEGPALARIGYGAASQYGITAADDLARGQSPQQAATNAIVPGLIGGAASGLFGARLSRDPLLNNAASTLQDAGVPLTTAQKTGSKLALQAENQGVGPFGMSASSMAGKQASAITAAALRPAGIDATRATPDVMADAYKNFNQQFKDLGSTTDIPYDQTLQNRIQSVVDNYTDESVQTAPVIRSLANGIDKVANNNGGVISGEQYQNIRSQIGQKLDRATNPDTKNALTLLQDALDDGVARNMSPDQLQDWQNLRRQYKNFVVARNALPAGSAEAASGIITPQNLANSVQQTEGQLGWTIGRGDNNDLAHAAMQVPALNPAGLGGHLLTSGVGAGLAGAAGLLGLHAGLGPELGALAAGAAIPAVTGGTMLAARGLSGVPQAALGRALLTSAGGS